MTDFRAVQSRDHPGDVKINQAAKISDSQYRTPELVEEECM